MAATMMSIAIGSTLAAALHDQCEISVHADALGTVARVQVSAELAHPALRALARASDLDLTTLAQPVAEAARRELAMRNRNQQWRADRELLSLLMPTSILGTPAEETIKKLAKLTNEEAGRALCDVTQRRSRTVLAACGDLPADLHETLFMFQTLRNSSTFGPSPWSAIVANPRLHRVYVPGWLGVTLRAGLVLADDDRLRWGAETLNAALGAIAGSRMASLARAGLSYGAGSVLLRRRGSAVAMAVAGARSHLGDALYDSFAATLRGMQLLPPSEDELRRAAGAVSQHHGD
jgi:hypothetical protein